MLANGYELEQLKLRCSQYYSAHVSKTIHCIMTFHQVYNLSTNVALFF